MLFQEGREINFILVTVEIESILIWMLPTKSEQEVIEMY